MIRSHFKFNIRLTMYCWPRVHLWWIWRIALSVISVPDDNEPERTQYLNLNQKQNQVPGILCSCRCHCWHRWDLSEEPVQWFQGWREIRLLSCWSKRSWCSHLCHLEVKIWSCWYFFATRYHTEVIKGSKFIWSQFCNHYFNVNLFCKEAPKLNPWPTLAFNSLSA